MDERRTKQTTILLEPWMQELKGKLPESLTWQELLSVGLRTASDENLTEGEPNG